MSTIEKMSICGIRSFGIEDKQEITFSAPLTLILGENGCGKTTIIECLKYALTGEMPPGSNRGQSFVHDPKIFYLNECLGRVRLQIKNNKGNKITVTRSMKTYQKKNQLKFETLDATMHYETDGQKNTISKRCLDTNVEMCQIMGVSKAILNNVIFCHQEDSSWPLDEAKKLKEKFDAIFGTTEYNKVIEKIMKLRKQYVDLQKVKEGDLKLLDHLKTESETKALELQASIRKLEKYNDDHERCETDLKPISERLATIHKIEMEMSKLYSQKVELTTKIEKCKEHQESLKSKIKSLYAGSLDDLELEVLSFNQTIESKKKVLKNYETKLNAGKLDEKALNDKINEADRNLSKLIYQREQKKELISERANGITDIWNELKMEPEDVDLESNDNDLKTILHQINKVISKEDKRAINLQKTYDDSEKTLQQKIDQLREQKAKIESNLTLKNQNVTKLSDEKDKNQKNINSIEKSAEQLTTLTNDIDRVSKEYEDYLKTINVNEIKEKIVNKKENREKLQENLENIDKKILLLNSIAQTLTEISVKEKQLELRDGNIKRLKNKHSDNFKKLFNNKLINDNYKRNVQKLYDSLNDSINMNDKKINQLNMKTQELQIARKNHRENLKKNQKELQESEDKVYELCQSSDYTDVITKIKDNITKMQLDHGTYKSSEVLYKRYISKIDSEPCCPLCHKDMTKSDITNLSTELNDEIQNLPEKIDTTEKLLKIETKKYEELMSLKPVIEKINKLNIDIPKLREQLKDTEENLKDVMNEVENLNLAIVEPKMHIQLANSILGDMSIIDESIKDSSTISNELKQLKEKLPKELSSNMTMEEVQIERTTIATELKYERQIIDKLQSQLDNATSSINNLREKKNTMKDKQIKLQVGIQELVQLKKQQEKVCNEIINIKEEIQNLIKELKPIEHNLKEQLNNFNQIKNNNRVEYNLLVEKVNVIKNSYNKLTNLTEQINILDNMNIIEEINKISNHRKTYESDKKQLNEENKKNNLEIESLNKEINGSELKKRDLNDNIELKRLENDLVLLLENFNKLKSSIGNLDFTSITKEKVDLINKQDNVTIKRSEILGKLSEIKNSVKLSKKELEKSKYANALKNYRHVLYEVEILKKMSQDLAQYRMALEWSLMKYHSEKMENINRLIRDLWREIYRGNDIDYIQIKTDEMNMAKVSADKRRNFTYRVIQAKNDVEIDMRGRCSAGQRILASLIIRIALAETFSNSCCILALDEPTTNLDRANIVSLCEALNKLVDDHKMVNNFMLIVITHDEEFKTSLGCVDFYYKLSRNINGKSIIEKIKIN